MGVCLTRPHSRIQSLYAHADIDADSPPRGHGLSQVVRNYFHIPHHLVSTAPVARSEHSVTSGDSRPQSPVTASSLPATSVTSSTRGRPVVSVHPSLPRLRMPSSQDAVPSGPSLPPVVGGTPDLSRADSGSTHGRTVLGHPRGLGQDMPFNPFQNTSTLKTPYEMTKTILLLPLFLVRALLLVVFLLLGYIFGLIALAGAKDLLTRPIEPWRRNMLWPIRMMGRGILFTLGIWYIKVKGKPAPRNVAPIIVSNHVSFLDPCFLFFAHAPVVVTAKENFRLPVVGTIMLALQAISVDRQNPNSRKEAAAEIKRKAAFNDYSHVLLFPEGTTTNGRALVSFRTGAFAPGLPVQPVVIRYPHSSADPSWVVEGPPEYVILFRLMTQITNFMEVEYLPVATPSARERASPALFAQRVRLQMARALNCPVTEHTYGDVALAIEAHKIKAPRGVAVVEFGQLERLFKLDLRTAKEHLRKFAAMDTDRSGLLTLEQFLQALDLPDTPEMRDVFELFDTQERGFINFREFLAGLSFISTNSAFKETVNAAFRHCDEDGDGKITRAEAEKGLRALFPARQFEKLFETMDVDKDGDISWEDFSATLQRNPEFLAVMMNTHPGLLQGIEQEDSASQPGNKGVTMDSLRKPASGGSLEGSSKGSQ